MSAAFATDRSLKIDEIEHSLCNSLRSDMVCISETWLDGTISDQQIEIDNYQIFRRDRPGNLRRAGGGVLIYAKEDLPVKRRDDLEHPQLEVLLTELTTGKKRVLIGCCYRAPNATAEEASNFIQNLQDMLNQIYIDKPDSLVLLGDFNDKCLAWDSQHIGSELKLNLFDLVTGNNLFQLINEPTHITPISSTLLDLIITDSPGFIIDSGISDPVGDPYHSSIFCKF